MAQDTTAAGTGGIKDPGATGSDTAAMTDQERDEAASNLVDRFSLWSGAAGLIPIPFVARATVGGVQLQMVRRLSDIHGVPRSETGGNAILAGVEGEVSAARNATATAVGVGSL